MNKSRKIGNTTVGEGIDSSILYDDKHIGQLIQSGNLLNSIITIINPKEKLLYCSDLQRTMQTAQVVLYHVDTVVVDHVIYVLPGNHEVNQCKEVKIKYSLTEKFARENETSIDNNDKWGEIKDTKVNYKKLKLTRQKYDAIYGGSRSNSTNTPNILAFPDNITYYNSDHMPTLPKKPPPSPPHDGLFKGFGIKW